SARLLASGLATAFAEYAKTAASSATQRPKCVLFVVQDGERNIFDQRHLEYELSKRDSPVPVFRLLFSQILQHTRVAETAGRELVYTLPWTRQWPQPSE